MFQALFLYCVVLWANGACWGGFGLEKKTVSVQYICVNNGSIIWFINNTYSKVALSMKQVAYSLYIDTVKSKQPAPLSFCTLKDIYVNLG